MSISKNIRLLLLVVISAVYAFPVYAEMPLEYYVSVTAQASSKSLAPYMLGSWNEGRYAEGSGLWQEAGFDKKLDLSKRFSWSMGMDYITGVVSKTYYDRWDETNQTWNKHNARLPYVRFQQLYGRLKYRSAFLNVGMKYSHSIILDDRISSGDVTRSNNAMPIPGISMGFLDFVDIPFTKGWIQINGELMYGKMMDSRFKKSEFNYYQGLEALNLWYNYKRCYFRTNPEKQFHVIVGMQAAAMAGGVSYTYMSIIHI